MDLSSCLQIDPTEGLVALNKGRSCDAPILRVKWGDGSMSFVDQKYVLRKDHGTAEEVIAEAEAEVLRSRNVLGIEKQNRT